MAALIPIPALRAFSLQVCFCFFSYSWVGMHFRLLVCSSCVFVCITNGHLPKFLMSVPALSLFCVRVPYLHWLQISPHDFYWFHSSNRACDRLSELAWPITHPYGVWLVVRPPKCADCGHVTQSGNGGGSHGLLFHTSVVYLWPQGCGSDTGKRLSKRSAHNLFLTQTRLKGQSNESSVIIYSPSCCVKSDFFFCGTQK